MGIQTLFTSKTGKLMATVNDEGKIYEVFVDGQNCPFSILVGEGKSQKRFWLATKSAHIQNLPVGFSYIEAVDEAGQLVHISAMFANKVALVDGRRCLVGEYRNGFTTVVPKVGEPK